MEQAAAQAGKDRKKAVVAYRNLGAIAGLADPKRALEAYEKALALDPDDMESLLGAGEIQNDYGDLSAALKSYKDSLAIRERLAAFRSRQRSLAARCCNKLWPDRPCAQAVRHYGRGAQRLLERPGDDGAPDADFAG